MVRAVEESRMKRMAPRKRIENRREQKASIVPKLKVAELLLCGIVIDTRRRRYVTAGHDCTPDRLLPPLRLAAPRAAPRDRR